MRSAVRILLSGLLLATGASAATAQVLAFDWLGNAEDQVGTWDNGTPDGAPDGRFRVTLDLGAGAEVRTLRLLSAAETGEPAGLHWSTSDTGSYVLGVGSSGQRLNSAHLATLGGWRGRVDFDLWASDVGWFKPGNVVRLEVSLGSGAPLVHLLRLGAAMPASPAPAAAWPSTAPPAGATTPATPAWPLALPVQAFGLEWFGNSEDQVGAWANGMPDGAPDGRFRLAVELGAGVEVRAIRLLSATEGGAPAGHAWSTSDTNAYVLGVGWNGRRVNATHAATLGGWRGRLDFDLWASDVGWFRPGNVVRAELALGDGTTLVQVLRLGGLAGGGAAWPSVPAIQPAAGFPPPLPTAGWPGTTGTLGAMPPREWPSLPAVTVTTRLPPPSGGEPPRPGLTVTMGEASNGTTSAIWKPGADPGAGKPFAPLPGEGAGADTARQRTGGATHVTWSGHEWGGSDWVFENPRGGEESGTWLYVHHPTHAAPEQNRTLELRLAGSRFRAMLRGAHPDSPVVQYFEGSFTADRRAAYGVTWEALGPEAGPAVDRRRPWWATIDQGEQGGSEPGRLDLNRAGVLDLERAGLSPEAARKVVEGRLLSVPYESLDEALLAPGLNEAEQAILMNLAHVTRGGGR